MKELIPQLRQAAKAYYQESREIMSNFEYDKLYDELVSLEKETGIVFANSPTQNVGYEVVSALPKERHEKPMLSLNKTKSVEELADWLGGQTGLLSWKMDGLTIVLTYQNGTLVNALLYHCKDLSGINGVLRPGIVHRIDKDTTGVLVVCKNDMAHKSLAEQLKEHSITRKYEAIVYNNFTQEEGTVDAPIGRSPADRKKMAVEPKNGKRAVTHYKVLSHLNHQFNHIECQLETGRTHQIRVHMASIRHPLLGDTTYGPKNAMGLTGQCLHARVLGFIHPRTGEYVEFEAPLPEYFQKLLEKYS